MTQGMLEASVAAGKSGPVIVLAGEADLTCAGQLSALITGQLASGTRQLTADVSGLRFADSASIRVLVLAARALKDRGGSLVLLRPQQPVARVLALTGADRLITICGVSAGTPLQPSGADASRAKEEPIMTDPARAEVDLATRQALARLAAGDAALLAKGLGRRQQWLARSGLDARSFWLVTIAALVAMGAPPVPCARQVRSALAAGVPPVEIIGVLAAIAAEVGGPKVVTAAPEIVHALSWWPAVRGGLSPEDLR